MENSKIYAVSVDGDVCYVKSTRSLYLHSKMSQYSKLEPYLVNKRGVYVLVGKGKVYVGEGDVFSRLTKHVKTKEWADEVYVYVTDSGMTKEDSLQYEGAVVKYLTKSTSLSIQNKVKVRDNPIDVSGVIRAFSWLGLTLDEYTRSIIRDSFGNDILEVVKTSIQTVKVTKVLCGELEWLKGLEFQSFKDIRLVVNSLCVGGKGL